MSKRTSAFLNLADVARRSEQALKHISRVATRATRLSTSEIYAAMGFLLGGAATYGALIAATATGYGLFFVPAGAVFGILAGALLGRDRVDRANERAAELIDKACQLRDRDVATLKRAIKDARTSKSAGVELLDQKLTLLNLASPQRLVDYYRLDDRRAVNTPDQVLIGPPDEQILATWESPKPAITDQRGTEPDPSRT